MERAEHEYGMKSDSQRILLSFVAPKVWSSAHFIETYRISYPRRFSPFGMSNANVGFPVDMTHSSWVVNT